MTPRTLLERVWDAHLVDRSEGRPDLLYVDLHLVHEVTSPQAFEGLRLAGRRVRRPDLTTPWPWDAASAERPREGD
jgi:3-isopropylmalate/(R)-2-methylmalate dehydratase large subunit